MFSLQCLEKAKLFRQHLFLVWIPTAAMFFRSSDKFLSSLGITAAGGGTGIPMVDFRFTERDKISEKQSGKALFYQGQLWKKRDFFSEKWKTGRGITLWILRAGGRDTETFSSAAPPWGSIFSEEKQSDIHNCVGEPCENSALAARAGGRVRSGDVQQLRTTALFFSLKSVFHAVKNLKRPLVRSVNSSCDTKCVL